MILWNRANTGIHAVETQTCNIVYDIVEHSWIIFIVDFVVSGCMIPFEQKYIHEICHLIFWKEIGWTFEDIN